MTEDEGIEGTLDELDCEVVDEGDGTYVLRDERRGVRTVLEADDRPSALLAAWTLLQE